MTRFRIVLAIVLVLVSPVLALPAEKGQTELTFSVGGGLPIGTFEDFAKPGLALGAGAGYYISPQFVLGGSLDYSNFGGSDDLEETLSFFLGIPIDASWSVLRGSAYGKFLFTPNGVAPYAKAAVGYYNLKLTLSAMGDSESESDSNLGLGGGFGLQFHGEGVAGGYIEAMAHDILQDGDDAQFIEIRAGLNLLFGGNP